VAAQIETSASPRTEPHFTDGGAAVAQPD
jgi:hypothetical protein